MRPAWRASQQATPTTAQRVACGPRHESTSARPAPHSHHAHGSIAATRVCAGNGEVRRNTPARTTAMRAGLSPSGCRVSEGSSRSIPMKPRSAESRRSVSVDDEWPPGANNSFTTLVPASSAAMRQSHTAMRRASGRPSSVCRRARAVGLASHQSTKALAAVSGDAPSGEDACQAPNGAAIATSASRAATRGLRPARRNAVASSQMAMAANAAATATAAATGSLGQTSRLTVTCAMAIQSREVATARDQSSAVAGPRASGSHASCGTARAMVNRSTKRPATATSLRRCVQCARPPRRRWGVCRPVPLRP